MEFKDFTDFNQVETFGSLLSKKTKLLKQLKRIGKQNSYANRKRLSLLLSVDNVISEEEEGEVEDNSIVVDSGRTNRLRFESENKSGVSEVNCNETNYDELGYVPESELDNYNYNDSNHLELSDTENDDQPLYSFISQVNSQEKYRISSDDEDDDSLSKNDNLDSDEDNLQIDSSPCLSQNLSDNRNNYLLGQSSGTQYVLDDRSSPIRDTDDQSITNYRSDFNHKALMVKHFDRSINRLSNANKRLKLRKKATNDELFQRTLRLLNRMKQSNLHFIHNIIDTKQSLYMRLLLEEVTQEFSQTYLICTVLDPLDPLAVINQESQSSNLNRQLTSDSKLLLVYTKVPLSLELLNPGVVLQLFPDWTVQINHRKNNPLITGRSLEVLQSYDYYIINGFNLMIEPSSLSMTDISCL